MLPTRHAHLSRLIHWTLISSAAVMVLCTQQGCASAPSGDTLSTVADFVIEHRPDIVQAEGCPGLRFEEGSPEKGRVALEVYPPCAPAAPPE